MTIKVFFFVENLTLDGQKRPRDVGGLPHVCKSLHVIIVQLLGLYMLTCLTTQNTDNCKFGYKCVHWFSVTTVTVVTKIINAPAVRGGIRSARGLGPTITTQGIGPTITTQCIGPTITARGQSLGISIGMLSQTLIMSRLDQLSRLGARILFFHYSYFFFLLGRHGGVTLQKASKYYTTEFDLEEWF
jgi:hypothetical protein